MERDPRTYAIIGAALEEHSVLGVGFLEAVYHEAFARELTRRGIPFRAEVEIPVFYKGQKLSTAYRTDFVCYDTVIVGSKALIRLSGLEEAQVINYLKASGHSVALLLNSGWRSLEHRRLILSTVKSA